MKSGVCGSGACGGGTDVNMCISVIECPAWLLDANHSLGAGQGVLTCIGCSSLVLETLYTLDCGVYYVVASTAG